MMMCFEKMTFIKIKI